ncbi:MAG: DUF6268 family outer membrane beta-barrel protein [Bacteroidia bacterium]|nr:DUF6268 family outer membrane beta-barrel protein [Bacteroidia bacterium]
MPVSVSLSRILALCGILALFAPLRAQEPDSLGTAEDEEDYSLYDDVTFADAGATRYCSPKIFDLSPQRFISIGWDYQRPFDMAASPIGSYAAGDAPAAAESGRAGYTGGLRLGANIPVVSRNSIVWQVGASFWDIRYSFQNIDEEPGAAGLLNTLDERGLRTAGLNTTIFKPLDEKNFILIQANADLSGDYRLPQFQSLRYVRYSLAALWGRRPSDRLMWGVGAARTYRVGEMNYIPVVLYNYTAPSRKWGTEILFPARAHVRRNFSPRSILLAGYELEGQSYRLNTLSDETRSLEIRRGELRARLDYQFQLAGFVWASAQLGWRYNWSFDADYLEDNGKEFFRGFFGDQPFAMLNDLGNPLYLQVGIHLVSP